MGSEDALVQLATINHVVVEWSVVRLQLLCTRPGVPGSQELQLMIKGLVGGLRTLCLAFALLFSVLYVIAVFATIAIGQNLSSSTASTAVPLR